MNVCFIGLSYFIQSLKLIQITTAITAKLITTSIVKTSLSTTLAALNLDFFLMGLFVSMKDEVIIVIHRPILYGGTLILVQMGRLGPI